MSLFTKNDSTSKLEGELSRLEKRKATLTGKLDAAKKAETAAREAQRQHLLSDDENPQTAAKIAADVASSSADVAAVTDAISTIDALIEEGRAAVTAARESAARARRASEISKKIERLEPLCAEAEKTFEKLADLMSRIVETADCPDLLIHHYGVIRGPGSNLPVATLAGAALTEAIFRSLPDGFTVTKAPTSTYAAAALPLMVRRDGGLSPDLPLDDDNGGGFRPLPLSGALTANLIAPLKQAAKEILDGTRPLASTAKIIADDIEGEPVMEWRRLVFVRPVKWIDWTGQTITAPDSDQTVPAVVAEAAIRAGAAHEHGTKEAEAHLDRRYQRGFHGDSLPMGKNVVTLDVRWPTTQEAA